MRKIILASISVLIFCISTLAQINESSPCPLLNVSGPSGLFEVGDTITYMASFSKDVENSNLKLRMDG